jgi:hypothetical protein
MLGNPGNPGAIPGHSVQVPRLENIQWLIIAGVEVTPMAFTTPTKFPPNGEFKLHKGDTYLAIIDLPDFTPTSYTLLLAITAADSQTTVTATDNGDGRHLVTITATKTNALEIKDHRYQGFIVDGSDNRYTLNGKNGLPYLAGDVSILADLMTATAGTDARSDAVQMLAALRSALKSYVDSRGMVASYSMPDGRTMAFNSQTEIRSMINDYAGLVKQEKKAEALKQGYPSGGNIQVRFNR